MTQTNADNQSPHPYSHHIFLFPFRWDYKTRPKENYKAVADLFTERTSLAALQALFTKHNIHTEGQEVFEPHRYWKRYFFELNRGRDFNEYTYFDASVRDVIFDREMPENTDRILLQYDYQYTHGTYGITVHDPANQKTKEKTYILSVTDIVLNFYQSGVGIISFHLDNFQYGELTDVLRINESGRRIYPPFLGDNCGPEIKATQASQKANILAKSITLKLDNVTLTENFEFYNRSWQQIQQNPERLPKFIHALLGGRFSSYESETIQYKHYVLIKPIIDDRMFTICWYGNNRLSRRLKGERHPLSSANYTYNYEINADWLSYTFIDPSIGGSLANKRMLAELNRKHTYERWVEYGTLYGITRYSFVALTDDGFGAKHVLPHMQTMYFQMVMLALVQRASLLRFSQEATNLASLQDGIRNNLEENVQGLYEKYLTFINKMYFRDVTAQEQGIELYDKLAESIELDKEIEITRREIDELNKYVSLKAESGTKKRLTLLTLLVSAFSIPSFLLTYYGMDFVKQAGGDNQSDSQIERFFENNRSWPFLAGLFCFFTLTAAYFWPDFVSLWNAKSERRSNFTTKWYVKWWRKYNQRILLVLAVLTTLAALLLPVFYH